MKLALALVALAACGGSSKPTDSPSSHSPTASEVTATEVTNASTGPTTSPTSMSSSTAQPAAAKKQPYSCFAYSQRGSTVKRSACMRTEECGPYLEQARQVGGIVADAGCASVDVLFCFHQAPTKADPQGLDVCQPTVDACKSERALLVKNGTSVDSDCALR
ncbi:MAG TPA: hypothetical protein VMZ53_04735 [Kofleriaceae bacterium]|nr:hypothetical protein [Kofleriaceae bacterium]